MYVQRNVRHVGLTGVAMDKAINITCSECVYVVSFIQHAKRMRRVILLSVYCLDFTYFFPPHYLIRGTDFGGKIIY